MPADVAVDKENQPPTVAGGEVTKRRAAKRLVHFGETEDELFQLRDGDAERRALVAELRADPADACRWWALLSQRELAGPAAVRLYRRATTTMSAATEPEAARCFARVWLGYATVQAEADEAGARETFKFMRLTRVAVAMADFYDAYARFEARAGNAARAVEVAREGLRRGAQPEALLKARLAELQDANADAGEDDDTVKLAPSANNSNKPRRFGAIGKPVRVQSSTDDDSQGEASEDDTEELPIPPPASGNANANAKAGLSRSDLSYITSWRPRATASTRRRSSSRRSSRARVPQTVVEEPEAEEDEASVEFKPRTTRLAVAGEEEEEEEEPTVALKPSVPVEAAAKEEEEEDDAVAFNPRRGRRRQAPPAAQDEDEPPTVALKPKRQARAEDDDDDDDVAFNPRRGRRHQADEDDEPPTVALKPKQTPRHLLKRTSSDSDMSDASPPESGGQDSPFRKLLSSKSRLSVNGRQFIKLEVIGRGGSSKVFKVLGPDMKVYAVKRIRLRGVDEASLENYVNEITLLERLRGSPTIVELVDAHVDVPGRQILMVMEKGEIDLNHMLQSRAAAASQDENFVRLMWQQMLEAVHTIHEERIVHGDLKPANFLFVQGKLKLIDFGIAKAISNDTTNIVRDSQVGTVNYMCPEAILDAEGAEGQGRHKLGRSSDIWALGIILYQMVYGKTPFAHLGLIQKLQAITNPRVRIDFPPLANAALRDVIERCLQRDPAARITMEGLMSHPFLVPSSSPADGVQLSRDQLLAVVEQARALPAGTDSADAVAGLVQQLRAGADVNLALAAAAQPGAGGAQAMSAELQAAIRGKQGALKSVEDSDAAERWQTQARVAPSPKDLRSVLQRGLQRFDATRAQPGEDLTQHDMSWTYGNL